MKKTFSLILAVLILAACCVVSVSAQESGNLLANGSFNTAATGGWWMRTDWNGGLWAHSDDGGFENSGCLIATGVGDGGPDKNAGLFYTTQEGNEMTFVPMAGEQYQLSFMVNFLDGTKNRVWMDVNEGALGSGEANHTGGWEKVSFVFTAPSASPLKIRCVVNALPEGKRVAVDEICLVSLSGNHQPDPSLNVEDKVDRTTTLLGDNLLRNGKFNNPSIASWWCRTDWNGGYWEWSENEGVDGTGCLKAVGVGDGGPGKNAGVFYTAQEGVENYLQLEPGKTYQLDASLYRPDGVKGALYIDVNEGMCGAAACMRNGEWQDVSFRFLAPDTPVKIRIVAAQLPTGQYMYADNVMLREVGKEPTPEEDIPYIEGLATIKAASSNPIETVESRETHGGSTGNGSALPFILAGAGVLVVGAAAVVVVLWMKKKKAAVPEQGPAEESGKEENHE